MGKFNFIPNYVATLPVLSSGFQTMAVLEMFNGGHLGVIFSKENLNIFQAPH